MREWWREEDGSNPAESLGLSLTIDAALDVYQRIHRLGSKSFVRDG
jgi:hypothetical protein